MRWGNQQLRRSAIVVWRMCQCLSRRSRARRASLLRQRRRPATSQRILRPRRAKAPTHLYHQHTLVNRHTLHGTEARRMTRTRQRRRVREVPSRLAAICTISRLSNRRRIISSRRTRNSNHTRLPSFRVSTRSIVRRPARQALQTIVRGPVPAHIHLRVKRLRSQRTLGRTLLSSSSNSSTNSRHRRPRCSIATFGAGATAQRLTTSGQLRRLRIQRNAPNTSMAALHRRLMPLVVAQITARCHPILTPTHLRMHRVPSQQAARLSWARRRRRMRQRLLRLYPSQQERRRRRLPAGLRTIQH